MAKGMLNRVSPKMVVEILQDRDVASWLALVPKESAAGPKPRYLTRRAVDF
jgi:hypothetical protein